jgi:ribosomal protein S18 acetylase RimI-like enzyme
MSAPVFREATEADLPAIVAMLADDDLGRGREKTSSAVADAYKRAFAEISASPDNRIIVAERDGAVVGTLQLSVIPGLSRQGAKRGQIEAVRVARETRGDGIGEALLRHTIDLARAQGCRLVQLTSDKRRDRAHAFYRGLGFEASHEGFKLELQP